MQRLMLGLDRVVRSKRRLVLVLWSVAFLAAIPFAMHQSDHLTGGGYVDPNSDSAEVERALQHDFPDVGAAVLVAVLVPHADAQPADLKQAIAEVDRRVAGVKQVRVSKEGQRSALASAAQHPDRPVVVPLITSAGEGPSIDAGRTLRGKLGIEGSKAGKAAGGRVDLHMAGQGALWAAFQDEAKRGVQDAEERGLPIIAIVLLFAFGSMAAALLPLSQGFAAVTVTGALIYGLSLVSNMSIFVTNLASLIGIGVAVDYSLFVLARYREEVASGREPDEARRTALATSGLAVAFSGATVVISLATLFLIDAPAVQSMAVGAIIVVAISVLASATLLPTMISLLGERSHRQGRLGRALERRRMRRARPDRPDFWTRWAGAIMRHPVIAALGALAVLLALAAPSLNLQLGNSGLRQFDHKHEFLAGVAAAEKVVGPGGLGPARVVVDFKHGSASDPANRATLTKVSSAAEQDPAVVYVTPPNASSNGRRALLTVVMDSDPEAQRSRDAVPRLRRTLPRAAGPSADVKVGGTTAVLIDYDELLAHSMWRIILFVLAFSFVVLLVVLRSLVLPLKAVVMNVLSVSAAYGVLVMIFQWGWLSFLGFDKAPFIDTTTPPLILAISFGVSMDYEIFLLARIRERHALHGDNRRAVAEGLAASGRTITSAALVMVAVAMAFVSAGLPAVQRLGLAAGVAIAVDATIVRVVLVPALMELFGRWNWWLPGPLERILPKIDFENVGGRPLPAPPVDDQLPEPAFEPDLERV